MMKKIFSAALLVMATLAVSAQTHDEVVAKYNEAGAKMQAKDYGAAITLFQEAVEMGEAVGDESAETVANAKKYLPQLYARKGVELASAGQNEEAVVLLERAVASDDPLWAGRAKGVMAQTYANLGGEAWNAEDYVKAVEYFEKARDAAPGNAQVVGQLAESYGKVKEYDKSYALFRELIAAGGDGEADNKGRLAFYMLLNANEIAESEPDKALEVLAEAMDLDDNPVAWELLMKTAFDSGNYDKLIEFGDRAAAAQTDAVKKSNAYSQLGFAYEKKGNNAKAIEAYRKVTAGPNAANAKAQITALQAQ